MNRDIIALQLHTATKNVCKRCISIFTAKIDQSLKLATKLEARFIRMFHINLFPVIR